jgi:hypothetical protein
MDPARWRAMSDQAMARIAGRFRRVEPGPPPLRICSGCCTASNGRRAPQRGRNPRRRGVRDQAPPRLAWPGLAWPGLAWQMIAAALDAGVTAAWVTGDEAYGQDPQLRAALEACRTGYVLAVACTTGCGSTTAAPPPGGRSRRPPARRGLAPAKRRSRGEGPALLRLGLDPDRHRRPPSPADPPQPRHRPTRLRSVLVTHRRGPVRAGPCRRHPLVRRKMLPGRPGPGRPGPGLLGLPRVLGLADPTNDRLRLTPET